MADEVVNEKRELIASQHPLMKFQGYEDFDDFINDATDEQYSYIRKNYRSISYIWRYLNDKEIFFELFDYLFLNDSEVAEPWELIEPAETWFKDFKRIPLRLYISLMNNDGIIE